MIDFRYHLVSLVSVFLALAVGIVLGAGPLKESIGTTLTREAQSLRAEKDSLRTDLDSANASLQHRDDFITGVEPTLVSNQLVGRSVVILTLPGVETDLADPLANTITAAGGTVTGRIAVGTAWVDPGRATDRAKVLTDLTAALPTGSVPATGDVDVRLAELLSTALVSSSASAVGRATATGTTVLDTFSSADLISVKGKVSGVAGGALLLAPGNPEANGKIQPTATDAAQQEYIELAARLDSVGGGAVVSGPASSATGGGVVAAIRSDDTGKAVSTVDTGQTPMGVVTAVLALREQLAGGNGAYGFGSGVDGIMSTLSGTTSK